MQQIHPLVTPFSPTQECIFGVVTISSRQSSDRSTPGRNKKIQAQMLKLDEANTKKYIFDHGIKSV